VTRHGTPTPIDTALRRLSQAANKGRLWLGIGACGVVAKGRLRRAAIRGAVSLAITSSVVNGVVKPLVRRQRPDITLTPIYRRLTRQPWTTSFPSGHAASAAAFTAGAGIECPPAGAALAPLAAAVGYSRVHVGVHHTSDVVIGAAIGGSVAVATQWWWPVRPARSALPLAPTDVARLRRGRGLLILVNEEAGTSQASTDQVARLLPEARLAGMVSEEELDAEISRDPEPVTALGVVGGDGSVAIAAGHAVRHGVPLAVFPGGTFNHFAQDLGLETVADSVRAVESGSAVTVGVGVINDAFFVNNVSLGPYPEIVRRRERMTGKLGRAVATAAATAGVLWRQQPVEIDLDGRRLVAWTVFVANGRYGTTGSIPTWRERWDDQGLDIHYLPAGPMSRTRAVLGALTGLGALSGARRQMRASVRIEGRGRPVEVAFDGEAGVTMGLIELANVPGGLQVFAEPADNRHS
jgi:diacylglycerol kinase family enzyme/membrane-associated phospholipid phosphatase